MLNTYIESGLARLRVALPGEVQSFDAEKQLVDVKPQIQELFEQEDLSFTSLPIPVIPNVPVAYPSGGGMAITFPLQAGDTGLIVFVDRAMDLWQENGGDSSPDDQRHHDLTDAVFIPGVHHGQNTLPSVDLGAMVLGAVNMAADAVALATKVQSRLDAIQTGFNTHTHPVSGAATLIPSTLISGSNNVASATVKVKG